MADKTADFVIEKRSRQIVEYHTSSIRPQAKVRIVKVDKVLWIYKSDAIEYGSCDQHAAHGTELDFASDVESPIISSPISDVLRAPPQTTKDAAGSPDFVRLIEV